MATAIKTFSPRTNPFQDVGVYSIMFLLFVSYSRLFDVTFTSLHIASIAYFVVIATSVLCGAFTSAFYSKIGLYLLAFSVWIIVDVPFSVWKGGSFQVSVRNWPKALMIFIAVAGLATTLKHCRQLMHTIAYAVGVLTIISVVLGRSGQGRLFIEEGKFSNPNDLAQALLIGLPFWWFMARNRNRTPFGLVIPIAGISLILVMFAKTGSRGGLIALGVMLLVLFFDLTPAGKLNLVIACLVLGAIGAGLLPKDVVNRYLTVTKADAPEGEAVDNNSMEAVAVDSAEHRKAVLKESLRLTLKHPVFGVGPGMFSEAAAKDPGNVAGHAAIDTHNTYTQVSSECGLPALFFFVGVLFTCLKQTTSIHRLFRNRREPRHAEIAATAFCIRGALIAYAVTVIFASVAYQSQLPGLAGLTAAFVYSVREDVERLRSPQGQTAARSPVLPSRRPFPGVQPRAGGLRPAASQSRG